MWRSGMTQTQLARALELDQSAVSKKIRGRRSWTVDELMAAALLLQVDVCQLMPGADYKPAPAGRGRARAA
jgi:transcriptional regulator with XRE-family HTH domain